MGVDAVFKRIKPFGRYQFLVAFIYSYAYFPLDINNLFMGYGGIKPKWSCSDTATSNSSSISALSPTDNCAAFYGCSPENLTFVSDFYSIATEWSLVCDRGYLISLITSIQMIGLLTGALTIGPVADLYGRKWTFFVVISLEFSLGALSGLSTSIVTFAIFRFCIGWCTGAEMVVGWVFTAESTINRYRLLVRVVAGLLLPMWNQVFIAYMTKHWKWYSIAGNLEGLPVLPLLALFTYESPRWLAQKGRVDEAREILAKIAHFNRTSHLLPENIEFETDRERKTYHIWDLFRARRLAMYTLASVGTWFAISLAHYGMFFDIGNLPTNVYLNGAVLAGVGMLVIPLAVFDAAKRNVNRKYMMVGLFLLTALCNAAVALLETVIPASRVSGGLLSLSSVIGQVSTEASFDVAYVYAIELFPTLLRSNANGLSSVSARLAGVIAPQILYARKSWVPLPYVTFAVISALGAGINGFFLPNTKNMHLPETYEQSNQLAKVDSICESREDQSTTSDCFDNSGKGAIGNANIQWTAAQGGVATVVHDNVGCLNSTCEASSSVPVIY